MTDQSRIEQIEQRWAEANDDIGIAYSIPADEWHLTCDKPTMQLLRHAPDDIAWLIKEVKRLEADNRFIRGVHRVVLNESRRQIARQITRRHDAERRLAEAWDEGFEDGANSQYRFDAPDNPYRGSNDGR